MTRAELLAYFRLDPLLSSTTVIADSDVVILLNQGALEMNRTAGMLIATGTFNTVASQQEYVLSGASPQLTGFLDIYYPAGGLTYTQSSGLVKLPPQDFQIVDIPWLDLNYPSWRTLSASDTILNAYLAYNSTGDLVLGQYPKPSTTTPLWTVTFIKRGTDMTNSTWYPWVGGTTLHAHLEPFHRYVAEWAMWHAHDLITKNDKESQKHAQEYVAGVQMAAESQKKIFAAGIVGLRSRASHMANQQFGGR